MKSSLLIVAASAVLATAGPVNNDKRALEVVWVDDIVTVTVTKEVTPTSSVFVENKPSPKPTTEAPKPAPKPEEKAAPKPAAAAAQPSAQPSAQPAPKPAPKPQSQPAPPKPVIEVPKITVPGVTVTVNPPKDNGNQGGNDYQRAVLNAHNGHRSQHSASALSWSDDLANKAAANANKCVFAHDSSGQNLASFGSTGDLGSAADAAAKGVSDQWYKEISDFHYFGQPNPTQDFEKWGHFTQVVWKGSQQVGCATVKCPAGTVLGFPSMYTVCNYAPAGNFAGQYANNVKPLSG
ncbi:hypothetical protein VHEMI06558 [[Torrubiella] hemipterigena]|uniref:SCP domain-containing protein n=1 Tax=[Torrubiella] hemipterigena TaxID=1531966 RepID=A0A0A1T0Z0_9HYPO|nr:hypothetical protein VHEMI06558 [[Torrubiella] hemipterigena]